MQQRKRRGCVLPQTGEEGFSTRSCDSRMTSKKALLAKAARLYKNFTGHDVDVAEKIAKPKIPDVLVSIGEIDFIGYTTVRDGEIEKYIHRFSKKARPLFAVSPDGKALFLLGGAYNFTERGIVDKT